MAAQNITLDERNQDQTIEFEGSVDEVCAGCLIDLEHNGVRITARVVEAGEGQPWVGEVTDFPNSDTNELGDLTVGSTLQFEDRHVFRCAA